MGKKKVPSVSKKKSDRKDAPKTKPKPTPKVITRVYYDSDGGRHVLKSDPSKVTYLKKKKKK